MSRRLTVIAHRGGAAEARENTLAAFERAIRLGYDGVECDVRMSRDGVPVVVHDAEVRPQAGGPLREVSDLDAAELGGLPTLDAFLSLPWGRMTLMIEVKPTDRDRELGSLVARRVLERGLAAQAIVASFSAAVLRAASGVAPSLRLMALVDAGTDERSFEGLALFAFGVDRRLLDRDRVRSWKVGGRQVWTWTIEDPGQMHEAIAAGVDGLITDVPGLVRSRL